MPGRHVGVEDEERRSVLAAEARALPLAVYEERFPVSPGWPPAPAAFLRFGEGYRKVAAAMARRGWPVAELQGEHVHMVVDPAAVAAALMGLADARCAAP